ncbi:hypothetical protein [Collimonas antrihumi]|uniref:hypothetical protein n=1 Tax=Collimonas antrihumi TaxID=1940615 RepID=UPI001B8C5E19|nr:hypothetical protein [Collimonas antrihumi]
MHQKMDGVIATDSIIRQLRAELGETISIMGVGGILHSANAMGKVTAHASRNVQFEFSPQN